MLALGLNNWPDDGIVVSLALLLPSSLKKILLLPMRKTKKNILHKYSSLLLLSLSLSSPCSLFQAEAKRQQCNLDILLPTPPAWFMIRTVGLKTVWCPSPFCRRQTRCRISCSKRQNCFLVDYALLCYRRTTPSCSLPVNRTRDKTGGLCPFISTARPITTT